MAHGPMYGDSFQDLDGHGWELMYMPRPSRGGDLGAWKSAGYTQVASTPNMINPTRRATACEARLSHAVL